MHSQRLTSEFQFSDGNITCIHSRLGPLYVTCVAHVKWESLRYSVPVIAPPIRSLARITSTPKYLLLLPFLGRGRFMRLIPLEKITPSSRKFVQRLRSMSVFEFSAGCFQEAFDGFLSPSETRKFKKDIWELAQIYLRVLYEKRSKQYLFLKHNFNLFQRRKAVRRRQIDFTLPPLEKLN